MPSIDSLIAELAGHEGREQQREQRPPEAQVVDLTDRFRAMQPQHQFKAGDLVQWREGLKNCKSPAYGHPAVVIEVLEGKKHDDAGNTGSGYYDELADLRISFMDGDGDFMSYGASSQRMEPYSGPRLPDDAQPQIYAPQ